MMKKIIAITGATSGLGKALAETLAGPENILAVLARDRVCLRRLKKTIRKKNGECLVYAADVSDENQINNFVKRVLKLYKTVDILINNAGWTHKLKPLEMISTKDFRKSFNTNVFGTFYIIRKILPIMKKKNKGVILNIASGAGRKAFPGLGGYSASKFAMRALSETAAKELERTAVTSITISPGGINTKMRAKIFGRYDAKKQQPPEAVAEIIKKIIDGKIQVKNGSDVNIREKKITRVYRLI